MAKDENIQVAEPENSAVEVPAEEVPVVKSKKELKKERKEIKKHKKEVKKEAARHSAKRTKAQNFFLSVISICVIVAMLVCSVTAIKITTGLGKSSASSENQNSTPVQGNNASTPSQSQSTGSTPSQSTPSGSTGSSGDANSQNPDAPAAAAPSDADLSTKEGIVEYYKAAHAKVLSSAKTVTQTYNNTINYNDVLEIGGNDTIAGIAKTLMNNFMKEDTEPKPYSGADIAANFPPAGGCAGLTPDMIADDASCTEEGDNYIIKLKINSTEENYDTGEKTKNLAPVVETSQITEAAGSLIKFDGLENRYIGANIIATIEKSTGNLKALEIYTPSYMCFAQVTAAVIVKVSNCRIGLEYQQKWTVDW